MEQAKRYEIIMIAKTYEFQEIGAFIRLMHTNKELCNAFDNKEGLNEFLICVFCDAHGRGIPFAIYKILRRF